VYTKFHGQIPSIGGVIPSAPSQVELNAVSYKWCSLWRWYGI